MSNKKRYHSDPEYRANILAKTAAYKAKHPTQYREWQRADRAKNPEKWRAKDRKRQGLPDPTRHAPAACEICGLRSDMALALDHDHLTGLFRGWLCRNCNVGLGHFRDNPQALLSAVEYLRK